MTRKLYTWIIVIVLAIAGIVYLTHGNQNGVPEENIDTNTQGEINGIVRGGGPLPAQAGLPEAVENTRQAIYEAANSRDYKKLAALATYPNFSYTFGGPYPGGFQEYLKLAEETEKESAFDVIPKLLALPYAKSGSIYAWPGIFYKEPAKWTEEDAAMMKTFLSDELIESYRNFGGYMYYRIGISETGEWMFYIAGD